MTTKEDTDTLRFGMELLKTILPGDAFYSRGIKRGPQLFMTDDFDFLKNALKGVWGQAELLPCVFFTFSKHSGMAVGCKAWRSEAG